MTYLEHINGPQDLKGLSQEQLAILASEIRDVLVETVTRTSGHLGPNLGVVELTIALHRVFDSPKDKLIFDTGHQSYVHKLLTGRLPEFHTLRQAGGPVGLPEPGRVRARPGGEQPRVDLAVLRRRHGQGLPAARRARPHGRRGDRRRRADRRHGLGGAQQHRRRPRLAAGHRGQRQRPLLPADDRRARQPPVRDPGQPALRAGARPDQDHGHQHPGRRQPAVRRAARRQEGPQGLPPAAGAVRGPRPQVHRPDRRPRRADDGARAAPGGRVRQAGAGARDHPQGVRLRAGRAERGGLPPPGPGRARRPGRRRPSPPRPSAPGPTCSPTRWSRSAPAAPTWSRSPPRCCTRSGWPRSRPPTRTGSTTSASPSSTR